MNTEKVLLCNYLVIVFNVPHKYKYVCICGSHFFNCRSISLYEGVIVKIEVVVCKDIIHNSGNIANFHRGKIILYHRIFTGFYAISVG